MKEGAWWQRFQEASILRRLKLCFFMTVLVMFISLLGPTKFIRYISSHVQQDYILNTSDVQQDYTHNTSEDNKFHQCRTLANVDHSLNCSNGFNNFSLCFASPHCASKTESGCLMKDTFGCKHLLTLHGYLGRTGNNIFQVAALLGIASCHGYTAVIDRTTILTEIFDLPNLFKNTNLILNKNNFKTLLDKNTCKYDERLRNISHSSNWTLQGYFTSWKYFEGAENIIRESLRLKDHLTREARSFINSNVNNNTQTVCIHVRRGDFLGIQNRGFTVAPLEYIKKAMRYFRNKYDHVHFFAVSDDKEWCRNNLRSANVTISSFKTVNLDMALMIESDHMIVTSGTFGWWGAWLCGGETVYWTGYPGKDTDLGNRTVNEYYYPRHWIGLS